MTDRARDPVINAIHSGIRRGIQVTVENDCLASAVILIYSGIDTMAYLAMPEGQAEVKPRDFIDWAERYIKFPCKDQLTGADMFGARCAMVHTYSVSSRLSRAGKARIIGYLSKSVPEVRYNSKLNEEQVLISVPALADSFFRGTDRFLVDAFSDKSRAPLVEVRMRSLVRRLSVPKDPPR